MTPLYLSLCSQVGSGSKYSERTYEELLEIVGERERQLEVRGGCERDAKPHAVDLLYTPRSAPAQHCVISSLACPRVSQAMGNQKEQLQAKYEILEGRMAEQARFSARGSLSACARASTDFRRSARHASR